MDYFIRIHRKLIIINIGRIINYNIIKVLERKMLYCWFGII